MPPSPPPELLLELLPLELLLLEPELLLLLEPELLLLLEPEPLLLLEPELLEPSDPPSAGLELSELQPSHTAPEANAAITPSPNK